MGDIPADPASLSLLIQPYSAGRQITSTKWLVWVWPGGHQ
jgi:hypothetical protein